MKCPKCQIDNRDGAKFCIECGEKFQQTCPECQKTLPVSAKFCDECGHNLSAEQKPPDYSEPQSYTPKFLADKILTNRSAIEGERKRVTILFADVANYTALAEKLDPEEVHQIMDGCFKILMDEIHKYEGTINQFTGDGVMALFGAPVAHEDHAQRACHAALAIQKGISAYGETIKKNYGSGFEIRIGLNTGPVIVGAIGDDLRMDYTAVGDTVNMASRMENLAEAGTVLASAHTHKIARDFFEFESLGEIRVKGKEAPQTAFRLVKKGEVVSRIEASAAKGLTRFVGRQNSMAALEEAYVHVKSGHGQVVGLVGEAGVGKSRLVLEFRNKLSGEENTWLEGRCLHYGSSIVYLPILELLKTYFQFFEEDREYLVKKKIKEGMLGLDEKLEDAVSPLQEILSVQPEDDAFARLSPKERREKIFEALRDLFIRESQEKPLIIVIEDLHWIDKTSEEFIGYLIEWLTGSRILLILLYRPEYVHQWGSKSYYTKIGLQQLGTASSIELIQALLKAADVVPEIRELIINRAAGNPLFMEEFTHSLLENGTIERKNNHYVLSEKAENIQVPDTIQGIIAARMDRLEENLKRTMQVAAVIGRDFAYRILHTITGMREDLKSCLLNLQGLEFIYEKRLFPELEYIFKHALIQEVAYGSLLAARRKEIHEKIGVAIEDIYVQRLEEFYEMLAYHYSKSENFEKACYYLRRSGEKAIENYSNEEAFRFYEQALNFINRLPDTEENRKHKLDLLFLMIHPLLQKGLPDQYMPFLHEGQKLATEFDDKKRLAQFYGVLGQHYIYKGDHEKSMACAEKCTRLAQESQDVELMVINTLSCWYATFYTGDFEKSADVLLKSIDILEKTKNEANYFGRPANTYSFFCAACGFAMGQLGEFDRGEILCEKGYSFANEIGDLYSIEVVEIFYIMLFCSKGQGDLAMQHAENAINLLDQMKIGAYTLGIIYTALGWAYLINENHEVAQTYIKKSLKLFYDMQMHIYDVYSSYFLATSYFESGQADQAMQTVEETLKQSQEIHSNYVEAKILTLRGKIKAYMAPSNMASAENDILKGLQFIEKMKLKPDIAQAYMFLGEVYAGTEKREKARENLRRAEEMFKEMETEYWINRTEALLSTV